GGRIPVRSASHAPGARGFRGMTARVSGGRRWALQGKQASAVPDCQRDSRPIASGPATPHGAPEFGARLLPRPVPPSPDRAPGRRRFFTPLTAGRRLFPSANVLADPASGELPGAAPLPARPGEGLRDGQPFG